MTFTVLINDGKQPQVIGTLFAADEEDARKLAPDLCQCGNRKVLIRKAEEREIPLKLN